MTKPKNRCSADATHREGPGLSMSPGGSPSRHTTKLIGRSLEMAAGKWLWEAAFGKPGQAADATFNQQPKQTLHIRWLPPDPNDRSRMIEPEPD
jgi:hypothetical protein